MPILLIHLNQYRRLGREFESLFIIDGTRRIVFPNCEAQQ